jgi:hypothetical protein
MCSPITFRYVRLEQLDQEALRALGVLDGAGQLVEVTLTGSALHPIETTSAVVQVADASRVQLLLPALSWCTTRGPTIPFRPPIDAPPPTDVILWIPQRFRRRFITGRRPSTLATTTGPVIAASPTNRALSTVPESSSSTTTADAMGSRCSGRALAAAGQDCLGRSEGACCSAWHALSRPAAAARDTARRRRSSRGADSWPGAASAHRRPAARADMT